MMPYEYPSDWETAKKYRKRSDERLKRRDEVPPHFCNYGRCDVDYCPNNTKGEK